MTSVALCLYRKAKTYKYDIHISKENSTDINADNVLAGNIVCPQSDNLSGSLCPKVPSECQLHL